MRIYPLYFILSLLSYCIFSQTFLLSDYAIEPNNHQTSDGTTSLQQPSAINGKPTTSNMITFFVSVISLGSVLCTTYILAFVDRVAFASLASACTLGVLPSLLVPNSRIFSLLLVSSPINVASTISAYFLRYQRPLIYRTWELFFTKGTPLEM